MELKVKHYRNGDISIKAENGRSFLCEWDGEEFAIDERVAKTHKYTSTFGYSKEYTVNSWYCHGYADTKTAAYKFVKTLVNS